MLEINLNLKLDPKVIDLIEGVLKSLKVEPLVFNTLTTEETPVAKKKLEKVKAAPTVLPEKEEVPERKVADEDKYYYHPESDAYWMLPKGEEIPVGIDVEHSNEISKEEYEKGTKEGDSSAQKVKETEPEPGPVVEEVTITLEEVRAKLAELSRSGKQSQVKDLINSFNVAKLTDIPVEKYAEVLTAAEAL